MWTWIRASRTNKIAAAISAVLLMAALGSVADGCRARKMAGRYLDLARGWHQKAQADEAAWRKRDAARADEVERLTRALKAARTGKKWRPPANGNATADRFRAAGYGAEVRR
jgi:hypothetical protein